jgi:hypothetical protein
MMQGGITPDLSCGIWDKSMLIKVLDFAPVIPDLISPSLVKLHMGITGMTLDHMAKPHIPRCHGVVTHSSHSSQASNAVSTMMFTVISLPLRYILADHEAIEVTQKGS